MTMSRRSWPGCDATPGSWPAEPSGAEPGEHQLGDGVDLLRGEPCLEPGHPAGHPNRDEPGNGLTVVEAEENVLADEGWSNSTAPVGGMTPGTVGGEDSGTLPSIGSRTRGLRRLSHQEQDDGQNGESRHQPLHAVDEAAERHSAGNPNVVKNQRELVSQMATSAVNTAPPATGRAHDGPAWLLTIRTLAAKAP